MSKRSGSEIELSPVRFWSRSQNVVDPNNKAADEKLTQSDNPKNEVASETTPRTDLEIFNFCISNIKTSLNECFENNKLNPQKLLIETPQKLVMDATSIPDFMTLICSVAKYVAAIPITPELNELSVRLPLFRESLRRLPEKIDIVNDLINKIDELLELLKNIKSSADAKDVIHESPTRGLVFER